MNNHSSQLNMYSQEQQLIDNVSHSSRLDLNSNRNDYHNHSSIYQKNKYEDDKLNKVISIYMKNPQSLYDEEKEIKDRLFQKQKNEKILAKQKYESQQNNIKLQLEQMNNNNNDENIQNHLTIQQFQKSFSQFDKSIKQSQSTKVLAENSNNTSKSTLINKSSSKININNNSNKERIPQIDYIQKNLEQIENVSENIKIKKKQEQEKKKQQQLIGDQQLQKKMENNLSQIQSRLFEQTEIQKLRQNQKKEEQEELYKRQPNKSLSIETINQADANLKIIERQKEYLKKLKQQVRNEKDLQQKIKQKNEEEKIKVKNNVLTSIRNDLTLERKITLDHHNLFLSKSTISQSFKQISLPEINTVQLDKIETCRFDEEKEKRKQSTTNSLFFPSATQYEIDFKERKNDDEDSKRTTMKGQKTKKLRPLPFINNMKEWKKKQRIPENSKIFIVKGGYKDFKKALLNRGWIENPQSNSPCFDLKWTLLGKDIDYDTLLPTQIVNHFEKNTHISSKIGLMNSLKNLVWFDSADPNTFFPICFDMNDPDEFNQFVKTFKLSKAESVLKKYLRLYLEKDEKYNQIKLQAQVALSILTRFNQDINDIIDDDKESTEYFKAIPDEEWEILASDEMSNEDLAKKKHFEWIKKVKLAFQGIRVKAQVKKKKKKQSSSTMIKKMIQNDAIKRKQMNDGRQDQDDDEIEEIEMDDFTSAVNQFLKDREQTDPQFTLKGEDNIWIVKPAGLSRGRGITCYKNLVEIIDHAKSMELQMVVQKYIESPILVKQRKFDIRIWVLVTDWNPLGIWYFDDTYVRFSADAYSTKNLNNKFQHLTNNAISKKKVQSNNEDEITSQGNMYTQEQLENFLIEQEGYNVFQEQIKPKIQEIIKWSLMSCCDSIESRKNTIELFGYDIMIDTNFNPWLLEVNTSPSLEYSTDITKKLVKQVLEDVAKVTVDYGMAQKSGAKKSELNKINTGKFIRIYSGPEIQDKGISSLGKNFICEGTKMKIKKLKKPKKTKAQKSTKDQIENNNQQSQSQILNKQKSINLDTQKSHQSSRPQTAQSTKSFKQQ